MRRDDQNQRRTKTERKMANKRERERMMKMIKWMGRVEGLSHYIVLAGKTNRNQKSDKNHRMFAKGCCFPFVSFLESFKTSLQRPLYKFHGR